VDPLVVVIFGLMGVGKTTLARALSQAQGWPVVHSDAVRKALAGLGPTTPARFAFGEGIYREDFSRATYDEMFHQAQTHLAGGVPGVILDASFKSAAERVRVRDLARRAGARVVFVCCVCTRELVRERLAHRADNATSISDGRLEILDSQVEDFDPVGEADQPCLLLDTGRDKEEVLQNLQDFLAHFLTSAG